MSNPCGRVLTSCNLMIILVQIAPHGDVNFVDSRPLPQNRAYRVDRIAIRVAHSVNSESLQGCWLLDS